MKKKFIQPEATVVEFIKEDIILTSNWSNQNELGGVSAPNVPSPFLPEGDDD